MIEAFTDATMPMNGFLHDPVVRAGLTAVLAIVQRDYALRPRRYRMPGPEREQCPFCMTGLEQFCPWHQQGVTAGTGSAGEERACGCRYERRAGVLVFTVRCAQHEPMCRDLEQWEMDLE